MEDVRNEALPGGEAAAAAWDPAGPWRAGEDGDRVGIALDEIPVYDANGAVVCGVWEAGDDFNEEEGPPRNALARAQLIGISPELLEIVRDVISCCDANDGDSLANAVNRARELVAKVPGSR